MVMIMCQAGRISRHQPNECATVPKLGSRDESESLGIIQQRQIKSAVQTKILSIALLADGLQFLGGDNNGHIVESRSALYPPRSEDAHIQPR